MFKFASICTSGGVFEQGVVGNGITPIWGVEIDRRVAELYSLNYPRSKIVVADACKADWSTFQRPDFLHASPSCRSFSQANSKKEIQKDIDVATAVSKAITHFLPEVFTLENVTQYQRSESWTIIFNCLSCLGYSISQNVFSLKDWGVPQKKRDRFIVVATLNQSEMLFLIPQQQKYWHDEIKDLIPQLEPHFLTNTQLSKLPSKAKLAIAAKETILLKRNQIREFTPTAYASEPECWSITATLCTDQYQRNRTKFADLVTSNGVFKLTTRCLARIQTISDDYKLSGAVAIDGLVIGDAIPPLFAQQLWSQILAQLESTFIKSSSQNKRIRTKQIVRRGKTYTEYYFRYYQDGKSRTKYVKKLLLSKVQEAIAEGKTNCEILNLLRGAKLSTSENDKEGNTVTPLSKRKKGQGAAYIVARQIQRGNKTYNQYWLHYEIWNKNKCLKRSKYIPKSKLGDVTKLNEKRASVKDILELLGDRS